MDAKRIMVIAGGKYQVPLVKKAKELGHFVVCCNLYPDSDAFRYADAHEVADVLDFQKNYELACQYRPDAIVTDQNEISVRTVARLCEQLGLPGIGTDKAELFTNKYMMRSFCQEHGFPGIDFQLCGTAEEALAFLRKYGEAVIKPLDSSSSKGVCHVTSEEELLRLFDETKGYSSGKDCVLIEQFLSGIEFTVDGIKCSDRHLTLAISEKKHYRNFPMVASELYFTNESERFPYERLREQNNRMVEAMGLPFGLTHAEYIWHDGDFYLVEIGARGGGINISAKIVPIMSGVDNYRNFLSMALGETVAAESVLPTDDRRDYACVLHFFDFGSGRTVTEFNGQEVLQSAGNGVADFGFNFSVGDTLGDPSDDKHRPGYYIAWGKTRGELCALRERIEGGVRICFAD